MKTRTIIADVLHPHRMNDAQYIQHLEEHIDRVDDALIKAIEVMGNKVSESVRLDRWDCAWEEFKESLGYKDI